MYNFLEFTSKLDHIVEHTQQDLSSLRTGKANAQMLDSVRVPVYGASMAINELANISVPDSNLIVIAPWDKNILADIEKSIQKSDLNLNPVVDRDIIRIVVAPLTEETRLELVKQLHQKVESARAMMRSVRSDIKSEIEDLKGQSGVSEDDIDRDLEELELKMDKYEKILQELATRKEQDLLKL